MTDAARGPLADMTSASPVPGQVGVRDAPAAVKRRRVRSIVSGSVVNLIEWYDWYVYSAFSLYFAAAFFPRGSQTAQLLNTAAVFAVGFLMRPVGGWLMGQYADRFGRRAALVLSVLLMCFGSLMIAVTPGFATIGIAAPVLLVAARMIQGVSLGGEYAANATYLSEMATASNRGYYGSFQYVTLIMGQLLAMSVLVVLQGVLSESQLQAWGWRIPFAIGGLCAAATFYLQRNIDETTSFSAAAATKKRGSMRALLAQPGAVLTVIGLTIGGTVAYYTFTTYMQKFLVNTAGWSRADATLISAATLFVYMLLQPVCGALSDRVGRRPMLIAFGIAGTIMAVPFLSILSRTTTDFATAFCIVLASLAVISTYTAISGVVKAEMFPTEIRALGVGFPYAVAVSLFGGTVEYIALSLKAAGHEPWFYWYVAASMAISLIVFIRMPDTKRHSRIVEEG
jgi:MFS transporter, MHS family, alpha-ketoglutarate permease